MTLRILIIGGLAGLVLAAGLDVEYQGNHYTVEVSNVQPMPCDPTHPRGCQARHSKGSHSPQVATVTVSGPDSKPIAPPKRDVSCDEGCDRLDLVNQVKGALRRGKQ